MSAAAWPADRVERRAITALVPYARNARTHSDAQVGQLAASMREWGWTMPVLISEDGTIIAGHGRVLAAQRLGWDEAPVMVAAGWTDAQRRAYALADNKLALTSAWDEELLKLEIADLRELGGVDLDLIGFEAKELHALLGPGAEPPDYTKKLEAPIYTPKGEEPPLTALTTTGKCSELLAQIDASDVSDAEKEFLRLAAQRHIVFDYGAIAEYYCHASPEMQRLMEHSALVIIDFENAIAQGFVEVTASLAAIQANQNGADDED